jgi:hypothetical protein
MAKWARRLKKNDNTNVIVLPHQHNYIIAKSENQPTLVTKMRKFSLFKPPGSLKVIIQLAHNMLF